MNEVCTYFTGHGIPYRMYEHPPMHTIRDAETLGIVLPGVGAKNLFLKDLKGTRFFLLVLPNTARADLKLFAQVVSLKKVTFATAEELRQYLGVVPGAVSLCGLLNDTRHVVEVYIHESLTDAPIIHIHPNVNTASLELSQSAFKAFVASLKRAVHFVSSDEMPLQNL